MQELINYSLQILPGLSLLAATYFFFKGKRAVAIRIILLILGFILIRDAMTPAGFWEFGVTNGTVPWVRFINDPFIVGMLGVISLVLTVSVVKLNRAMRPYLKWGKLSAKPLLAGVLGAVTVILPFIVVYQFVPLHERGGEVALSLLPALFVMAMLGNLMEEVLFRGYLQGYLEKLYTPVRAAVLSALMFALGHVFLATTVTDLGIAIILFTLYEGAVCAFLRLKFGIWSAAMAHGLAIFALASGLI